MEGLQENAAAVQLEMTVHHPEVAEAGAEAIGIVPRGLAAAGLPITCHFNRVEEGIVQIPEMRTLHRQNQRHHRAAGSRGERRHLSAQEPRWLEFTQCGGDIQLRGTRGVVFNRNLETDAARLCIGSRESVQNPHRWLGNECDVLIYPPLHCHLEPNDNGVRLVGLQNRSDVEFKWILAAFVAS